MNAFRVARNNIETASTADNARFYRSIIGPIPWTFASTIRALLSEDISGRQAFGPESQFQVGRMLKSPSVTTSLYHFIKILNPEYLAEGRSFSPFELARQLDPLTLASFFAVLYLFKRTKRICPVEEWPFVSALFNGHCLQAVELGRASGQIGVARALLAEGVQHAALGAFAAQNVKHFKEYRRFLKTRRLRRSATEEMKHWQCTSVSIAAHTIIALGFGSRMALDFEGAYTLDLEQAPAESGDSRGFWLYNLCANVACEFSFRKALLRRAGIGADEERLEILLTNIEEIVQDKAGLGWLDKSGGEADPGKLPWLRWEDTLPPGTETEPAAARSRYEDLPPAIQAEITLVEFQQLRHLTVEEIVVLFSS